MKIALCQFNPHVGDLEYNTEELLSAINQAKELGCDLFIAPELAICGYYPQDLLLVNQFHNQCQIQLEKLQKASTNITTIIGSPRIQKNQIFNSAYVFNNSNQVTVYDKNILPNYGVFDEKRYFTPGNQKATFKLGQAKVGVVICEDIWGEMDFTNYPQVDLLCVLNASPFEANKQERRYQIVKDLAIKLNSIIIYVNCVGGQDELVFDGGSFMVNQHGKLVLQLDVFNSEIATFEFNLGGRLDKLSLNVYSHQLPQGKRIISFNQDLITPYPDTYEAVYTALTLGLSDYVYKNKFSKVVLGLSGGIDSALVLKLAVDALGCDNVYAIILPTDYTSKQSYTDANQLIDNLGVRNNLIDIEPIFKQIKLSLEPIFKGLNQDLTEENLQARIRGMLLMAISNKFGHLVLVTSNKSEVATGFGTLYGDMAGGFAPIKDIYKTMVFDLCKWINRNGEVIPNSIITKAPSAELRPNQLDQDSLPPYDILDQILYQIIECNQSSVEIIKQGFAKDVVEKVIRLVKLSEYKRKQAASGTKVSSRSFGLDWRYPVTNGF